jgi:signal transduction histidine kinase
MSSSGFDQLVHPPVTLRAQLIKVILGALAPVIVFSAALIILFARQEQATLTRGLQETTRALGTAVEKEFESSITSLQGLASSEALDTGQVSDFRRIAWRVLRAQENWAAVALFDWRGTKIFDNSPTAIELAAIDRESLARLERQPRPWVGNFSGAVEGVVQVYVPVTRENKLIYILSAAIERRALAAILLRQKIPAQWIGMIVDGRKIVVARTLAPERTVGKPAGPFLRQADTLGAEQVVRGDTSEGTDSYAAISTLAQYGWSVALLVPAKEVSGPLWRSLASVIGAALVSCLAGIWLASWFARSLAEPIRALSTSANALGASLPVVSPPLPIVELNSVAQDMQRAAELLRQQSDARDRVEADLREREGLLERQANLLRQSEEALRRQAEELEQQLLASGRLVAVGELTASMAHEFNNPLGIILGFAQGLLAEMDAADPNYHHVEIIAEEAQRCEKLVQELLEFGRPRSAEFAQVDLQSIIDKTVDLVSNRAAKSNVSTTVNVATDVPAICADMQQLQQVLLNLSLNAIDAMARGGSLTISAIKESAGMVLLTVADSGAGIDADMLRRIFQPFVTANKRRGLGLGLPICHRIVKAHGGVIEVESEPGKGTTFRIHLPINGKAAESAMLDA